MTPLVIYHGGGCKDGFAAAWLFHLAFPGAEFVPACYGQPPPDAAGREVFVLDFSFKRPVMLHLIHQSRGNLTVLDHHQSAEADLAGIAAECYRDTLDRLPAVVFDMDKSGARLAWEYLYGRAELPPAFMSTSHSGYSLGSAPWLVDYTEDRDLWRWAMPQSREVNAALRTYPLDFGTWDELHVYGRTDRGRAGLAAAGGAVLRAERFTVDAHAANAREAVIAGHRVLCVNATTLASEVAGRLAEGRPFGACYFDRFDGRRVYSLRSRGGIDVSAVAALFGGGGHRNAAGFECDPAAALSEAPTKARES